MSHALQGSHVVVGAAERVRSVRVRGRTRLIVGLVAAIAAVSLVPSNAGAVAVVADPGFAATGKLSISVSSGAGVDEALAVAIDADERIVAAGYATNPRQQMSVVRVGRDGVLDPTFGEGGVVKLDFGVRARAQAMLLQDDGKIVLAGYAVTVPSGTEQLVAARLLEDGTLDPDFGDGGVVVTGFGTRDARGLGVAVQADGGVVVAGWARTSSNRDLAFVRYTSQGLPDATFGSGGKVTYGVGAANDEATAVAVQADGRIVFTGYAADGSTYDLLAGRLLADGTPDPSFGGTGFRRISASDGVEQGNALLLQPDGKVLIAGESKVGGSPRFALARVDASGVLDPTFAGGGVTTTGLGELAEGKAIAAATRGRFVVAGRARPAGGKMQFAVARYLASGVLDPTFAASGILLLGIGERNDEAWATAVGDDGAIALAGGARIGSNVDFGLVRLLVDDCGDGFLDVGEECDGGAGASCCSASCTILPQDTVCRAAADACDVAEVCDGVSGTCPADDFLPDADLDGICDEEDLCPLDPDPLQRDGDHDGLGDVCDPCTGGTVLDRTKMRFAALLAPAGENVFRMTGSIDVPGGPIDPVATGARVLVHAADGSLLFDARLPGGKYVKQTRLGWRVSPNGRTMKFMSPQLYGGLVRKMRIMRAITPGRYNLKINGRGLDVTQAPLFGEMRVTVVLDPPRAVDGRCGELSFTAPEYACTLGPAREVMLCSSSRE